MWGDPKVVTPHKKKTSNAESVSMSWRFDAWKYYKKRIMIRRKYTAGHRHTER